MSTDTLISAVAEGINGSRYRGSTQKCVQPYSTAHQSSLSPGLKGSCYRLRQVSDSVAAYVGVTKASSNPSKKILQLADVCTHVIAAVGAHRRSLLTARVLMEDLLGSPLAQQQL